MSRRHWIGIGFGAIALVLAAILLVLTSPRIEPRLIGVWETHKGHSRFAFHSNGDFTFRSINESMRGYRDVELRDSGKWGYRNETIFLQFESREAFKDGKPFPELIDLLKLGDKRTSRMPIRWRNDKTFISAVNKSLPFMWKGLQAP